MGVGEQNRVAGANVGFTLLEVLIVLGLVASLLGVVGMFAINPARGVLREQAMTVASALRSAYNGSVTSGLHHRVVFDLGTGKSQEQQKFAVEVCRGAQRLRKREEEDEVDEDEVQELLNASQSGPSDYRQEITEANSPEDSLIAAAAIAGLAVDGALCQSVTEHRGGNPLVGELVGGAGIERVAVEHLEDVAKEGKVSVNFFPEGRAEKTVVALRSEDDERMWVVVHGLTGRIEVVFDDEFEVEKHMRRNAVGDDIEDNR